MQFIGYPQAVCWQWTHCSLSVSCPQAVPGLSARCPMDGHRLSVVCPNVVCSLCTGDRVSTPSTSILFEPFHRNVKSQNLELPAQSKN